MAIVLVHKIIEGSLDLARFEFLVKHKKTRKML
jgi:hypothetical protein